MGAPVRRKAPEQFVSVVPFHFFGSKSTISRFREGFPNDQYSFVSFLFAVLLLTVPRAQPFVKMGARSPVPHEVGATASLQQRNVANLRIRRNIVYGIYTCRNTRSANNYILTTHSLSK